MKNLLRVVVCGLNYFLFVKDNLYTRFIGIKNIIIVIFYMVSLGMNFKAER